VSSCRATNAKGSVNAVATVSVVVEIALGTRWGADCRVEQVHEQAKDVAIAHMTRILERERSTISLKVSRVEIKLIATEGGT
jgi:hypothetical protein